MSGRASAVFRRLFRGLTFVLFIVCLWTIYANVLSDDTAVRAQAGEAARKAAGCGDKCKVVDLHGERGMLSEVITFTMEGKGQYVATCRRSGIVFGEYECSVAKP